MAHTTHSLHPIPSQATLKQHFIGADLRDVEAPAAVIDAKVARHNCKVMLDTTRKLGLGFRAHVKTHKTVELTRLQVGDGPEPARLIVSTVAEALHLVPFVEECVARGREVNILYGIPPSATCLSRLSTIRKIAGPNSLSFLIDNASQLDNLLAKDEPARNAEPIPIFIKCDSGYHRAGLSPDSRAFKALLQIVADTQHVRLMGFYTHNSNSYSSSSPKEAIDYLRSEIACGKDAVWKATHTIPALKDARLTVSVGATPSASSIQNLLSKSQHAMQTLADIEKVKEMFELEIHAGVYPLLDLQQLASHARPSHVDSEEAGVPTMKHSDVGLRIIAEVLSVYNERSRPEALIGAGTLALGREPCKSYPGWATVAPSPWNSNSSHRSRAETSNDEAGAGAQGHTFYSEDHRTGWIVDRISQEHGILTWHSEDHNKQQKPAVELEVGQKVLLWPNHACIAGAGFPFYLVVDSEPDAAGKKHESTIVDVWVRARGW